MNWLSLITPRNVIIAAALAVAAWLGVEVRVLRADLADAETTLALCVADRATAEANTARLAGAIDQQNAHIAELKAAAEQLEADTALRVEQVLRDGDARQNEIQTSAASGAEELNEWLRNRFAF